MFSHYLQSFGCDGYLYIITKWFNSCWVIFLGQKVFLNFKNTLVATFCDMTILTQLAFVGKLVFFKKTRKVDGT